MIPRKPQLSTHEKMRQLEGERMAFKQGWSAFPGKMDLRKGRRILGEYYETQRANKATSTGKPFDNYYNL
jgi:hypothetical protein